MLCKYVNDTTIDICTSSKELEFLGLRFSTQMEKMKKEDVEDLIKFLVEHVAMSAGYYPPDHDDDYGDYDDYDDASGEEMQDVDITAAVEPDRDRICFRITGLVYGKEGFPQNYSTEPYPGANDGLFDFSFDKFLPERNKGRKTTKEETEHRSLTGKHGSEEDFLSYVRNRYDYDDETMEEIKKSLNTPQGQEFLKRLKKLRDVFLFNKTVDALYFAKVKTLDKVKAITDRVPGEIIKSSAVYKLKNDYYLEMTLREPAERCASRVLMLSEFSKPYLIKPENEIERVKEYGITIIKNDVKNILGKTLV